MSSDGNKKQFWKRNTTKVPGSLMKAGNKPQTTPGKPKKATTFQEFESITSDAWDVGDDDDELLAMAAQNLNIEVVMETANKVIENHSKLQEKQQQRQRQQEETHPGSDCRLVKSQSEAPIGSPKDELRKLSWSGIPRQVRPITWKLLSGYLPANAERRESTLQRKRQEYFGFIEQYYDSRNDEHHQDTYRQIHIDIPRMSPENLVLQPKVTEVFERILFIWAIRHPASGYVQGINDLVTPFFVVYVFEYIEEEVENFDVSSLQEEVLRNIEADSFWCMSKLLDGIQDNYTFAQPGIQRKVKALEELVSRIDETVHRHMQQYEVEYLQFAFRWMNNLLMRELPLRCTIRLWDTYQAEPEGFSHFHLYVCAAFLVRWRKEILEEKDFQGLMILLQNLPTMHWGNEEVSVLLAEAYRLKFAFADAPNHYKR
ncbi:TBC1 domain family member 22A isoform X3 [Chanos chanos]|uniref:TBC1 domain family member 22A isoform X3 n=1 Tax=Chanos chanos TaxID=29144 RepID=A0A6J2V7B3_CHACN|nr:TBC1 domain family member 22A isoform X3 [Chanos chanos]